MASLKSFTVDRRIFNRQLFDQVIDFWFADLPRTALAPSQDRVLRWFGVGDQQARQAFDDACRTKFQHALDSLGPASVHLPKFTTFEDDRANAAFIVAPFLELDEFQGNGYVNAKAEGVLSLILLLDQFSRNIFRDRQAVIYNHYDRLSRALTHQIMNDGKQDMMSSIEKKAWCLLSPPWRQWFYIPLMHSEDLKDHDEFSQMISEMKDLLKGNEAAIAYLDDTAGFEDKHRKILEQFGRYPHRNVALGRETSLAEKKWLEQGGDTFGTG